MWDRLERALRAERMAMDVTTSDNDDDSLPHELVCQAEGIDRMLHLVQRELVPRLLMAHASQPIERTLEARPADSGLGAGRASRKELGDEACAIGGGDPDVRAQGIGPVDQTDTVIRQLANACVDADDDRVLAHVEARVDRGYSIEQVYLTLLAPTARYLGDRWLDDTLSFVDVHLGLLCLHRVLNRCEERDERRIRHADRSIFLSCLPGEQHTFGVSMLAEFFRRAGWHVAIRCGQSIDQMASQVGAEHFACIGISLSSEAQIPQLASCVDRLRQSSRNREALFVVGGSCFVNSSPSPCPVGVDLCVVDAADAVDYISERVGLERPSGVPASLREKQLHDS